MAITGYEVRVNGGSPIDVGNVLEYLVSALSPDTEYDFEVRSYTDTGARSEWSAVVSATTLEYLLSLISATPLAAYSIRKLSSSYSGPAIRVERPSDNAETDLALGFTKADADAFGANLTVVKWYDQSGNGNDFVSQGTDPTLYFGQRPMIDFSGQDQTMELRSEDTVSVSAPKQFMAVDPIYASTHLSSFGASVLFDTRFEDGVSNNSFRQDNGSDVIYDNDVSDGGRKAERGEVQVTSWFASGDGDAVRVDGVALAKVSGTNAGDTTASTVNIVLGNRHGGTFEGSVGKYGEYILFEGTVSTGDRDIIEASQKSYFTERNRIVFHGDSLAYGTGSGGHFSGVSFERTNVSHHTREGLGEGWGVYNRSVPGSSLANVSPAANLTTLAPLTIDTLYRAEAQKNICVLWTGWNDVNGGADAEDLKTQIQTYCEARQAEGWQMIVVSLPLANYSGQPVGYPAIRTEVNDWLFENWPTFANGYADLTDDLIIGDAGDTSDTDYWTDELHMTEAGYEIVAGYIADAIAALEDTTAPSVPTSFAAGTPDMTEIPFTWAVSTGTPVMYQIRKATDSGFTANVSDTNIVGGASTSGSVTGLTEGTLYYFKIRARDAAGNWSAYSSTISATTDEITPLAPDAIADCVLYVDAEEHVGLSDGATVTDMTNNGSGANFSAFGGTSTKETVGGDTVVRNATATGIGFLADSNITGADPVTIYALVKLDSETNNQTVISVANTELDSAIIAGYDDDEIEYYPTPRTLLANINTSQFQLVKMVGVPSITGAWQIRVQGDWKFFSVHDRSLTAGEQAALEAWAAARVG